MKRLVVCVMLVACKTEKVDTSDLERQMKAMQSDVLRRIEVLESARREHEHDRAPVDPDVFAKFQTYVGVVDQKAERAMGIARAVDGPRGWWCTADVCGRTPVECRRTAERIINFDGSEPDRECNPRHVAWCSGGDEIQCWPDKRPDTRPTP